jgi:tRNA nucleotidyltransferase (CCA-adding enzyme)
VPAEYRDLAVIVARYHGNVHRAFELRASTVLEMLQKADAFRRPERFAQALLACEADSRGRLGLEQVPYPQRAYLLSAQSAAAAIKPGGAEVAALSGPRIAAWLRETGAWKQSHRYAGPAGTPPSRASSHAAMLATVSR